MDQANQYRAQGPERFWALVEKGENEDDCWEWTGRYSTSGYGAFWIGGKLRRVNRYVWEIMNGEIPDGLFVLHRCDNKCCVRPSHLFLGTQRDNVHDMWIKGRGDRKHGEKNGWAKLTSEQVIEMRARYVPYKVPARVLAKEYGISEKTTKLILQGKAWKHL